MKNKRLGEEKLNNFGSKMKIIEYKGSMDIDVYFPEYNWTAKNRQYSSFKKGIIKCPYEPRTMGIGFIGEGKYNPIKNKIIHNRWKLMLERCYSNKVHERQPSYINCTVCEEWYNFQNFAKWHDENYYNIKNEQMCLDKDILTKGNKIYSPNTCIFVPQRINKLFVKCDESRGDLPIGMSYNKKSNLFRVTCNDKYNKAVNLGEYSSIEKAFQIYKNFKEKVIKEVANEYKDLIPKELYDAMYRYKVEITD